MVAWDQVSREDVLAALEDYDRLGAEQFLSQHGYGPSRTYVLIWNERHYPHKAILGTAYELATGQRLAPGDFEGGKAGAVRVLTRLGFTVQPLGPAGTGRRVLPPHSYGVPTIVWAAASR